MTEKRQAEPDSWETKRGRGRVDLLDHEARPVETPLVIETEAERNDQRERWTGDAQELGRPRCRGEEQ